MREATTKAMPVIVEEERQSRQGRPAGVSVEIPERFARRNELNRYIRQ